MDSPCPHWAHHNHSDKQLNLVFTPFYWQSGISSPPASTNFDDDDDDDNNNNNNHPPTYHHHHHHHRSHSPTPPPSTSHNQTDSGYFTLRPSSSPRRPNKPLTVINTTPSPQTFPSIVEEHPYPETANNINTIRNTRISQRLALRWISNDDDDEAVEEEETGLCASKSMRDRVLCNPVSDVEEEQEGNGGTGFGAMRLRRGFGEWLGRVRGDGVDGLDLERGGGVEGWMGIGAGGLDLESGDGGDEEGRKESLWSRVKKGVGWRDGPVRLKRAKERFLLE